jgi:hypothetical protein
MLTLGKVAESTTYKKLNNNTAKHHGTIPHLQLDLLHRLELFYGKQQTSRTYKTRDI